MFAKDSKRTARATRLWPYCNFNLLEKDKFKLTLRNKRLKAAWDWPFLMQLIQIRSVCHGA